MKIFKQKRRGVMCAIASLLLLASCSQIGRSAQTAPEPIQNENQDKASSAITGEQQRDLQLLQNSNNHLGTQNSQGFYRLIVTGESHANIAYIDFDTEQMVYLCAQPNCTHQDKSCSSWIDSNLMSGGLVAGEDFLYVFTISGEIWKMNPDGTNREQICDIGVPLQLSGDIATDGTHIFWMQTSATGNGSSLYSLDLSNKSAKVLKEYDATGVLEAVNNNNLVVRLLSQDSTSQIVLFDVTTNTEQVLRNGDSSTEYGRISSDMYVYFDYADKSIKSFSLTEKSTRTIIDNLPVGENAPIYINEFIDNHLAFTIHHANGDGPYMIHDYYSLDLLNGNLIRQLPIADNKGEETAAAIAADMGSSYLVRSAIKVEEHNILMDDGTVSVQEGPFSYYSIISKEDYWNGISNYRPISVNFSL